jgi:trigger factor
MIGTPQIQVEEITDGVPVKITAEVDVRPELTMPDFAGIEVPVPSAEIAEEDVDGEVAKLRDRFATLKTVERSVLTGDFVQLDLAATVDGEEVPGGSAKNISHEVGSGKLVPGLDDVLVGMSAQESTTFTSQLVGGDFAGKDAEIAVTILAVKQRELPDLNDDFAGLASEFDTLDEVRTDLRSRLERAKRFERLFEARDKAVQALVDAVDVPTPESVVQEEVQHRKERIIEQLEQMGATLNDYLAGESRTEEDLDRELVDAASNAVRVQLVLDALADAENVAVTDDEFGLEVMHRAQRARTAPEQYYEQLIRSGAAAEVYGDVRRAKALAVLMERVRIVDTDGNPISFESLREAASGQPAGESEAGLGSVGSASTDRDDD